MSTTTPLNKLHEVFAKLIQAQTNFTATIGSLSDDTLWGTMTPFILNGNAVKTVPGPAANQLTLKASGLVLTVPLAGLTSIRLASDKALTAVTSIPVGARNDGTNYFFSEFTSFNETPVLLANKFNHIYMVYDVTKTNNAAVGVISNNSVIAPSSALFNNLDSNNGDFTTQRQAVCYVNNSGNITLLQTFSSVFNPIVSVPSDTAPSFADWTKNPSAVSTNVIQLQFTFPAGTGTGSVGELAINSGSDIIAFLPISPQLLKDADIALVVKWNLMIGEPGAFL
jgi:hypothetical protein